MRALVYSEYGSVDVLRLEDLPKPEPKDNEVLIKVRASSVNALDWRMITGTPWFARPALGGTFKPKPATPGADVAGVVEAVGPGVTQFKPGDAVFGGCNGAFAEYACAAEDKLARKPLEVSFEHAASLPVAALTALQGLRDYGNIREGRRVLIEGASGGVGSFAVPIAKSFGAEVTAVCSTRNLDAAQANGADHVIDYTREDFAKNGLRYDLILGANAYHSIFDYRRSLEPDGVYVMAGGGSASLLQGMLLGPLLSLTGSRKMRFFVARFNTPDLETLADLVSTGQMTPIVDKSYPLSDAADAIRHLQHEHARGKVVVTVDA